MLLANLPTLQQDCLNLPRQWNILSKHQLLISSFVLMSSSELCNKKPYAVPVQCIPYAGLKEVDIRKLVFTFCKEMKNHHGMKAAGMYIVCYNK